MLCSSVEVRATGVDEGQGVAAVGMMRLFLWPSLMIVQPVRNTAHGKAGPRDLQLVPGLGSGHHAAACWEAGRVSWTLSVGSGLQTSGRLRCGCVELKLGLQSHS